MFAFRSLFPLTVGLWECAENHSIFGNEISYLRSIKDTDDETLLNYYRGGNTRFRTMRGNTI